MEKNIQEKAKKNQLPTPYKINCFFQHTYESPLALSIYDLFAKFIAQKMQYGS